jgi:NADH:ubiquinone oxidoreductase subunit D
MTIELTSHRLLPRDGLLQISIGSLGSDIHVPALHPLGQGSLNLHIELHEGLINECGFDATSQHRGDEKLLENRDFRQGLSLINRNNWLSAASAEVAYAVACEDLMGLQPPPRAIALRKIAVQLSSLIGEVTFLAALAEKSDIHRYLEFRSELMDLQERLTGARMHVSYIRLGGVSHDVSTELLNEIIKTFTCCELPLSPSATSFRNACIAAIAEAESLAGPISVQLPKVVRVPVGQSFAEQPSTTGTVGVWVFSDGNKYPHRVALSAPSLSTLANWTQRCVGLSIDQALEELMQLRICLGEIAR